MQKVDEAGIFAVLIPGKKIPAYYYIFTDADGESKQLYDPYAYEPFIDAVDIKKFESGIHYNVYEKLGSHVMEVDGVSGVLFAVWAPKSEKPARRSNGAMIFDSFVSNATSLSSSIKIRSPGINW